MAYQSNLMGDFWRGYRQKRIGSGMPLSQNEIGGLLGPMLETDARKAEAQGLRDQAASQFDRQMLLKERERKDQQRAGVVSGVGQVAMLPMAYQSAKNLGWVGGANAAPAASPNLMGAAPAAAGTAQGAVAPVAAGTTAQGAALGPTTAAEMGAYDSAVAAGAAEGVGSTAGTSAGLLGTTSTVAGPAALGAGIGMFGMSKLTGAGKPGHQGGEVTTSNIAGGIIGGAIAGAAATSWSGPGAIVGGVIGGIIGAASSLF